MLVSRWIGIGRPLRVALGALGIVVAGSFAAPGVAGAAASVTTAFDTATCDLVINGTGFTVTDVGSLTELRVAGLFLSPHGFTPNFEALLQPAEVLDDGAWTVRIPAADVGPNSGTVFVDTESDPITVADLTSPCVAQPAYLDAQGLILTGQETIRTGHGPVEFEATVNGYHCRFVSSNAAISIIDGQAVIGEDHIEGSCLAPSGASLPTGAGEVTSVVVFPGSSLASGGAVTGATTVGTICGTATCLTGTGPATTEPLCLTTTTLYERCDPIAISIDFTLPAITSSTPPADGAIFYDVTTDSGAIYHCAATYSYRSLGGDRYDVVGPAVGTCGSMFGSTSVVSLVVQGIGPVPPAYWVDPIGPYDGTMIECDDPIVACSWRLAAYPYPTTATTVPTTAPVSVRSATTTPIATPVVVSPSFTG